MVILMNLGKSPFKVEYTSGSQSFVKTIPTNAVVAMKQLRVSEQISNRDFLANHGVTIYNYERGTYYGNNTRIPSGNTLPFVFVGNNTSIETTVSSTGFSGSTIKSGMTFTVSNVPTNTVYGITTSANTVMANGTISAVTIGNNTFVSFSGANTTTQNVYGALTGSTFSGFNISITGQGATKINTGATITFFLSASTADMNAPFTYLQRLV